MEGMIVDERVIVEIVTPGTGDAGRDGGRWRGRCHVA